MLDALAQRLDLQWSASLAPYTTLRAGGVAAVLAKAATADQLADAVAEAHRTDMPLTILGHGSNVLPSDAGIGGLTLINGASEISVDPSGEVVCDAGASLQDVFMRATQTGLVGLAFAVGIPGTIGGAMVSNAGAYRRSIGDFVTELEVVERGERKWVSPSVMQFGYRDSILRSSEPPPLVLVRCRLKLERGDVANEYEDAREYQRQRISKQPPPASAGSFFKNVLNAELAKTLPGLSDSMRESGVVPAGFLIEAAGLKGFRLGGAMLGYRHANFILNVRKARATDIRRLADHARHVVWQTFGAKMEEEVLYLGDWSAYESN